MRSKWHEAMDLIYENQITTIIETKIDGNCSMASVEIDDFMTLRLDRNRHGGGILIYVNKSLKCQQLLEIQEKYNDKGIEAILLSITMPKHTSNMIIVAVYRPPGTRIDWFSDFNALILELLPLGDIVIKGDLNANLLNRELHTTKELLKSLALANTSVSDTFITRVGNENGTCLDIIAISENLECKCYKIKDMAASDHFPVVAEIAMEPSKKPRTSKKKIF